jgi:hypothetical protein
VQCPPKRQITGIVPRDYWMQMQLQLEVAELPTCHFLECEFSQYRSEWEFWGDSAPMERGMILYLWDSQEAKPAYRYAPMGASRQAMATWTKQQEATLAHSPRFGIRDKVYWRLEKYSCVVVKRDQEWFASVLPSIKSFWHEVCYYRTQNAEVLYRDYGKKMPAEELDEEESCEGPRVRPTIGGFLTDSDDDVTSAPRSTPSARKCTPSRAKGKNRFLSDSDTERAPPIPAGRKTKPGGVQRPVNRFLSDSD